MVPRTGEALSSDRVALRDLVREFDIQWETGHERAVVGDQLRTIGLTLELTAAHPHPTQWREPGCPECVQVTAALRRVIEFVLPKEQRASFYEVSVPPARHVVGRSGRPEMTATVTVLHEVKINEPVDACERRCLDEMVANLRSLGATRA
jgi:hypothetical protein